MNKSVTTPNPLPQLTAERVVREDLPLAVYREVAAHLQQIPQVEVKLEPRRSPTFNYFHSQIGAMEIRYPADLPQGDRQKIDNILDFYSQRYGPWQRYLSLLDIAPDT